MSLTSLFLTSIFVVAAHQVETPDEPLAMIEAYHVNQRSLGLDHPRMRELREKIGDEINHGFQFDLPKVQKHFEKLTLDRRSLLRTKGLTHPYVIENATRLSLMSRLLAGQSASILRDISDPRK